MVFCSVGHRMRHVTWKDQKAFNQTGRKNDDHRKRDVRNEAAETPPNCDEPEERDNRRQRCGKNRAEHPFGRILGRSNRVFAQNAETVVGMFAHYNGIIHHDPQRDDQRKKRDHIDRQPRQIHQRDSSHHRHRYTRRDPKCGARIQEQEQQPRHQGQPCKPVFQQDVQTARYRLCARADQINGDPFGQRQF